MCVHIYIVGEWWWSCLGRGCPLCHMSNLRNDVSLVTNIPECVWRHAAEVGGGGGR